MAPNAVQSDLQVWQTDNGYETNAWMWNLSDVNVVSRDSAVAECIYLNEDERVLYCADRTQEMCDGAMRDWFCNDPSATAGGSDGQCDNDKPETCYRVVQGTGTFGSNDVSDAAHCCTWDPTGTTLHFGVTISGHCKYEAGTLCQ